MSKKMKLSALKSRRELKKLEWTINYKKARVVTNVGISGEAFGSGCK